MLFSDLLLSRRLERAEGHACVQFAEARQRLFPDSGAEWIECGAYAVFDRIDSRLLQLEEERKRQAEREDALREEIFRLHPAVRKRGGDQ